MRIAVWAPERGRVQAIVAGRWHDLRRDDRGWWSLDADVPAGVDYAFSVDGSDPLPDPRAAWLPHGVHGPARTLDHGAFAWSDADWQPPALADAVFYELHVGTFSPEGTFAGVRERLDALVDLGVTHVELMPVQAFAGRFGWGYDGVGWFAVHEPYGGPDELKRLVDACHRAGLAVVLDVVYNHLGPEGNVLDRFAPYTTDRYKTPWGPAINFDGAESDEVRRFVCDSALAWLRDYHFDGLRLDAVHGIVDTSAVHILEQLAIEAEALAEELGRPLVLIAESDLNDPRIVRPRELGGFGVHAQWCDDFHHALHAVLTGERQGYYADYGSWDHLARALQQAFVLDGRWSTHRRRRHGRPIGDLGGERFVVSLQNHDQVGNRALGERIAHLAGPRFAKVGAALTLLSPFVPLLFQGEEWAASSPFLYFADHADPQLAEGVRQGRKREFADFLGGGGEIPDPESEATFERSKLVWEERSAEAHARMLAWYRTLIALRRSRPELRDGRLDRVRVRHDEASRWLTMQRGPIVVAANLGVSPCAIRVAGGTVLAATGGAQLARGVLTLSASSVAVLETRGA